MLTLTLVLLTILKRIVFSGKDCPTGNRQDAAQGWDHCFAACGCNVVYKIPQGDDTLTSTYRVAAANRRTDPTRTVDTWLIVEDNDGTIQATKETFTTYQKAQLRVEILNKQLIAARMQSLY